MTLAIAGLFVAVIPVALVQGLVLLPREYDALAARGVPERVMLVRCGMGVGGDSHHYGCRLRSAYAGQVRERAFDTDLRNRRAPDGTIGAVVDPQEPGHWVLPEELANREGAGWSGSKMLLAGMSAIAAAFFLTATAFEPRRRLRG
jgi:hypothetical protein